MKTVARFTLRQGERATFVLNDRPSHEAAPPMLDAQAALCATERAWAEWSARSRYDGRWPDTVMRSLITLKALIYAPTGGIVAAPTTSLPEQIGGVRNWDYRFCWLRDATFAIYALLGEQYDPIAGRQLGNFPQAFSQVGLINTAQNLRTGDGPSRHRQM
jgi:GH15 family glucan-1,4-alpha-glucosidase